MAKRKFHDGIPIEEKLTEKEVKEWGIDKNGVTTQLAEKFMKGITCNKCGYKFVSKVQDKDIRCPSCKSNESFSIREALSERNRD